MSGLSSSAAPIAPVPGDTYVAGACNIGPWEIRRRRIGALLGFAVTAILFVLLVASGLPAWTRLLLVLPLWGSCVSWLQARRRFCVNYAMRGLSNFGGSMADQERVVDAVQHEADLRATLVLIRDGFLLAIVPTIVAVLLPI